MKITSRLQNNTLSPTKSRQGVSVFAWLFLAGMMSLSSCYSFRGTSIPSNVKSYFVEQTTIDARALLTPGDLPERFMEALRAKVRDQASLSYNKVSPDIEFHTVITNYKTDEEVRSADNNTATLLKLQASVKVEYISNTNEDDNWTQTFSHTINFEPTIDFQTAEDGFIDEILEQITEQIFNKAFTNW